jgi:hypothetical protein
MGTVSLGAAFGGTRADDLDLEPEDGSSMVFVQLDVIICENMLLS